MDIGDHLGPLPSTTVPTNSVAIIVTRSAPPFGPAGCRFCTAESSEILDRRITEITGVAGTGLDDRVCPPWLITGQRTGAVWSPACRNLAYAGPSAWAAAMTGALVVAGRRPRAASAQTRRPTCFSVIADLIGCLAPLRGSNYERDHLRARGHR